MELETIEKKEPTEDTDDSKVIAKRIGTGSNILHLLYNFSKQLGKVAVVYLLGYFNISPAWLIGPVILSVLREEWGKEKELKRNIAKAAALSNEKDVILARVDDLPAWVSVETYLFFYLILVLILNFSLILKEVKNAV